ncbi:tumor necrosis factor receptor superfamily member 9a isoform X2 [Nerophis ophidion]|uniref:tumor necrosis factor receptor superfamily member 9a isoform X2 n=1 Tax=Nerophis ophidion TaxID=159077 RepID=UPI002ADFE210|nr:tumor necrosis factor receptor superfamily member 9a isoform X2 [Nerophis ophidion]
MKLFLHTLSLRLLLLAGSPLGSPAQQGCKIWNPNRTEVCCEECHPGNRLVKNCGLDPKTLCTPCESGTFTKNPKADRCDRCTQCEGAQVLVKECTTTSDTKCGCKDGLLCCDHLCSFCSKNCSKGEEPRENYEPVTLIAIECSFHDMEEQQSCSILDQSVVSKEAQEHSVS